MKPLQLMHTDTIVALATPPGRGGIGIVRVSGPQTRAITQVITATTLVPRYAHYGPFLAEDAAVFDRGNNTSRPTRS